MQGLSEDDDIKELKESGNNELIYNRMKAKLGKLKDKMRKQTDMKSFFDLDAKRKSAFLLMKNPDRIEEISSMQTVIRT